MLTQWRFIPPFFIGKEMKRECPPIWMMRQAGRYQPSYMKLKEKYTFAEMCKIPEVATQVAMLPINEFDFDFAILFSDILWHLEGLGLPMEFNPGPKFDIHLSEDNWKEYRDITNAINHLSFQHEAITLTRAELPDSKDLLGFVGGPWSLLNYALGPNEVSIEFKTMYLKEVIIPLLKLSITSQLNAGADRVMILDSGLDNVEQEYFNETYLPMLHKLSDIGDVGYYMRGFPRESLANVVSVGFDGIGIDSTVDLPNVLKINNGFTQGNFDEKLMLLEDQELLKSKILEWLDTIEDTSNWVCGLGHGIIKETPTQNVELFVETVRDYFR